MNAVHELFVLFSSVGELGAIFLPSKFHTKVLDSFPWILPSRYRVCVLTLLSFYVTFFCYDFCSCRLRALLDHPFKFGSLVLRIDAPFI